MDLVKDLAGDLKKIEKEMEKAEISTYIAHILRARLSIKKNDTHNRIVEEGASTANSIQSSLYNIPNAIKGELANSMTEGYNNTSKKLSKL